MRRTLTAALVTLAVTALLAAALAGCGSGSSAPSPAVSPAPTFSPPARPASVHIPALEVTSNVIDLGLQSSGEMEVPPDAKDAGWYIGSPVPGQPGPSVLAAHVNWHGEDGPFARLHELKAGDEIVVESADGAKTTFVVDRVETHSKTSFPAEQVYGDTEKPEIRLVTCGGSFNPAEHSYESNVIAFGHLAT